MYNIHVRTYTIATDSRFTHLYLLYLFQGTAMFNIIEMYTF